MGHLYHGYVSHNQRVKGKSSHWIDCCLFASRYLMWMFVMVAWGPLRARDISKDIAVDTQDVKKNTNPLLIITWFAYRRLLIIHYLSHPSITYHPLRSKDTADNAMTPPVSVDRWDNDLPGPWRQCLSPGRQKRLAKWRHGGSSPCWQLWQLYVACDEKLMATMRMVIIVVTFMLNDYEQLWWLVQIMVKNYW